MKQILVICPHTIHFFLLASDMITFQLLSILIGWAFLVVSEVEGRWGGGESRNFQITHSGAPNFHPISTISYKSWFVELSFATLVRSLRLLVWPQQPFEMTKGKERNIIEDHYRTF